MNVFYESGPLVDDSLQKNITKLIETFKLETYDQYTKGSKLMELSLGEVTSHRDQISSIGFFSSIEMFLALKKVIKKLKVTTVASQIRQTKLLLLLL